MLQDKVAGRNAVQDFDHDCYMLSRCGPALGTAYALITFLQIHSLPHSDRVCNIVS